MKISETYPLSKNGNNCLKTELSLGLPGSESEPPEKQHGFSVFGKDFHGKKTQTLNCSSSIGLLKGAKRGFSDAIDGSQKWVLSINRGESNCDNYQNNNGHNLGVLKKGNSVISVLKPCVPVKQEQSRNSAVHGNGGAPAAKAQVVGWPPIRSFRKNSVASTSAKNKGNAEEKPVTECLYVKVSMDGAPYLRKVDLQVYANYMKLSSALEKMFNCFISGQHRSQGHVKRDGSEDHPAEYIRSEYVLTYEDKDGDWMLVGDVPWKMFTENCRKLRIMKGSEAIGLDSCK